MKSLTLEAINKKMVRINKKHKGVEVCISNNQFNGRLQAIEIRYDDTSTLYLDYGTRGLSWLQYDTSNNYSVAYSSDYDGLTFHRV